MKYSIITPVYNSFELMDKYFHSFEHQTYKDFELIIVDDCSTDDSYEKILEYISKSNLRITILKTKRNGGPGIARNLGMEKATGEWITFVDNDDWVETYFLDSISKIICENDSIDCIIYDFHRKSDSNCVRTGSMLCGKEGFVGKAKCMACVTNHTIGKFYKLSNCIKNGVRFPATRRCEDVAFTCLAIDASNTIYYHQEPLYYYYQRSSSLSNSSNLDHKDMVIAFDILQNRLTEKYPNEIAEKSVRDLLYGGVLMMAKAGKNRQEIIKYIADYESKYPEWYKSKTIALLGLSKRVYLFFVRYRFIYGIHLLSWLHSKMVR